MKKKYNIAKHIYFILSKSTNLSMADNMTYKINYLNAKKQLHEIEYDDKQIKNLDVSMAEGIYKVAKSCLENNDELTYKYLNELYPHEVCANMITTWPLFMNFKESEWYKKFKAEHIDDFKTIVFENDLEDNDIE